MRSRGDCVKPFVTFVVSAKSPRASNKDEDNDVENNDDGAGQHPDNFTEGKGYR